MLTNEDIQKLIKAHKTIFATKEDIEKLKKDLRQDFGVLQTSVDNYAKRADTYFQEMVMLSHKVDRLDKWIHQIAQKVKIELEI